MILKGLLEQEITKDVIEYKIFYSAYLTRQDPNVASALINKLYNLLYDAKLYVRAFEELDAEEKKALFERLDENFGKISPLKDERNFNLASIDAIFWSIMNYLSAKSKEDFDRILAKVKNKAEE